MLADVSGVYMLRLGINSKRGHWLDVRIERAGVSRGLKLLGTFSKFDVRTFQRLSPGDALHTPRGQVA
jgi:hypothetical protein